MAHPGTLINARKTVDRLTFETYLKLFANRYRFCWAQFVDYNPRENDRFEAIIIPTPTSSGKISAELEMGFVSIRRQFQWNDVLPV